MVPNTIPDVPFEEIKYTHFDFVERFVALHNICEKDDFIIRNKERQTTKISYEGRQYIKFFQFYKALISAYGPIWITLGGLVGLVYGLYSFVVDKV